ncbi:MAG TPA: polysaccharide biosynthesis/export family protein [Vicinamibacterales bacterium]|nr:polysaccharide biosynthesis/export family protein [Vicinamibacterales bacterium]
MLHTLLSLFMLFAQAVPAPTPSVPLSVAPPQVAANPASYLIGPSDVIAVKVFNEDDLSGKFTVDSDGTITMNLIGRFPVAGLTTRQIEEGLVKALQPAWLKNAQVSVEIASYRSRSIYVLGEVRSPGRYNIEGPMTLLEVIANAGSTTAAASNTIIVQRYKDGLAAAISAPTAVGDARWAEVMRIDLEEMRAGKLSANLLLQDSDMIIVPAAERYYVSGMVKTPGSYVLRAGMTVRQAIAEAGGLTERGSYRRLKVIRKDKDGKESETSIELSDLVRPNDVIKVAQRLI